MTHLKTALILFSVGLLAACTQNESSIPSTPTATVATTKAFSTPDIVSSGFKRVKVGPHFTVDIPDNCESTESIKGAHFVREPDTVSEPQNLLSLSEEPLAFDMVIAMARSADSDIQGTDPYDIIINGIPARRVDLSSPSSKNRGFIIIARDHDNALLIESDNPLANGTFLRDNAHYATGEKIAISLRRG